MGLQSLSFGVLFGTILLLINQAFSSSRGQFNQNQVASTTGICASSVLIHGYKCQEYHVTTDDGYILSVQRIPEGRKPGGSKQPVLLQHGVIVDGASWLMSSPEQSLAMILADSGYDVWINNLRGTKHSRQHTSLDSNDPEFWNWTWDELVIHDLPAAIGFVFQQTGKKLHYVGHSMGTLMALASFSEGKQIDKVRSAALLSPIAYLSHMTTPLGVVAANVFVGEITTLFGLAEFNPSGEPVGNLLKLLCAYPGVSCYDLITAITGHNCCLNSSTVDLFLKYEPQPTSTKNLVHMAQTVRNGRLTKYDYGFLWNLAHYGAVTPPVYDLSKIPHDLPMFLSYGGRDALSDVRDVATLLDSLKYHDVGKLHVQFIEQYAHVDFIMGVTAKDIVYNQMIKFFNNS